MNKSNLSHFLFTWQDIKGIRERETNKPVEGVALLNDSEEEIPGKYTDAILNKGAEYIKWSERSSIDNLEKLVA